MIDAYAYKELSEVTIRNDEIIIKRLQARRDRKVKLPSTPI